MSVLVFARDIIAFPVACFSGARYQEIEEKACQFLYSAARVAIACGVIWALYKMQYTEGLRNLAVPTVLCNVKLSSFSVPLEPISLLFNLYLFKKAVDFIKAVPLRWERGYTIEERVEAASLASIGLKIWKCMIRTFQQRNMEASSVFFSASLQRTAFNIDGMTYLMNIATWKIPESRLGIGCSLMLFGIQQLDFFNEVRSIVREVPTQFAFYGIAHLIMGLGWLVLYKKNNDRLERTQNVKQTCLYRAAHWSAPYLAWLVTGGKRA